MVEEIGLQDDDDQARSGWSKTMDSEYVLKFVNLASSIQTSTEFHGFVKFITFTIPAKVSGAASRCQNIAKLLTHPCENFPIDLFDP